MLIRYSRTSLLIASHVLRWENVQIGCRPSVNSQNVEFLQVKFRPIISTDKTYVGYKYTNLISSSGIFQALLVSDRLYIKFQNTSCFGFSKSNS